MLDSRTPAPLPDPCLKSRRATRPGSFTTRTRAEPHDRPRLAWLLRSGLRCQLSSVWSKASSTACGRWRLRGTSNTPMSQWRTTVQRSRRLPPASCNLCLHHFKPRSDEQAHLRTRVDA